MKVLLGVTIVLMALVSLGLVVYAYTEHRDVAYLTLRADHLEDRITELESGSLTVDSTGADVGASTATEVITLSEDESGASAPNLTLEEINRQRAKYGLPPRTLEEVNRQRAQYGQPPIEAAPSLAESNSIRNDFIANRMEREEAQRQVAPPTTPGPVVYTDQELHESREKGPDRPECEVVRQRAARNVPGWMELNFISAFGCLTPTEERIRKLENQAQFAP